MLNKDVFLVDPSTYNLSNEGVAKITFPVPSIARPIVRDELATFVCDGAYADGLARILEGFNQAVSNGSNTSAVWISGFYGSGKSHLATVLAALWVNLDFEDGATAEGLIRELPSEVKAALVEFRGHAKRSGGSIAAGDTMGQGAQDPAEATLQILLRAAGLPDDVRPALVALWLHDEGILDAVRSDLGDTFDKNIRAFVLSTEFQNAVLRAKPSIAVDTGALQGLLKTQFGTNPEISVDFMEKIAREALLLGREEIPLTLVILDELQQFIRQDPGVVLKIQTIAERLSSRFDGRILLVATGQQALSSGGDLGKLLGRFPIQIGLKENDIDTVIRKTVLLKKPGATGAIKETLTKHSGEISRHLSGSKFAHSPGPDDEDAVLDWPVLPTRRRVWEAILRELDRTGLGGTLRGQLRTTLEASRSYAERPLGHAVPVDFLYNRFAPEAYSNGILPADTRNKIERLASGNADDKLKARVLALVFLIARISGDVQQHGVEARADTIADLLIEDLGNGAEVRARVPNTLESLRNDGAIIEIDGVWRLQTKESSDWEQALNIESRAKRDDVASIGIARSSLLTAAIESLFQDVGPISHGTAKVSRPIARIARDERAPEDKIYVRFRHGWNEDLESVRQDIAAANQTDHDIQLLIPRHRTTELETAIVEQLSAAAVTNQKGLPQTDAGKEAAKAMAQRGERAAKTANEIVAEAVAGAEVLMAGGARLEGTPAAAIKVAAARALQRLFPNFGDGDHEKWGAAYEIAKKRDGTALTKVDFSGGPETHPISKVVLKALGSGMKGAEIRSKFTAPPYGWPQDAIDTVLTLMTDAGTLRVTGGDGVAVGSLSAISRSAIGLCFFRAETRPIAAIERVAVRGLLNELDIKFTVDREAEVLPAAILTLKSAAAASGGIAPAPEPSAVPDIAQLESLSGNDLLASLASQATDLKAKLREWKKAEAEIAKRLPAFRTAEILVASEAGQQATALVTVKSERRLLDNPNPVPPILAAATDALRLKLNEAWAKWEAAWQRGEEKLKHDLHWSKLDPAQRSEIRSTVGLRPRVQPKVDTAESVAASLQEYSLGTWNDATRALAGRVDDAIAQAVALLEPSVRELRISGPVIRSSDELDAWLNELRDAVSKALANGPVMPRL